MDTSSSLARTDLIVFSLTEDFASKSIWEAETFTNSQIEFEVFNNVKYCFKDEYLMTQRQSQPIIDM